MEKKLKQIGTEWLLVLFCLMLFGPGTMVRAEKFTAFGEVLKPEGFFMDDSQYYLVEKGTVFIYSRKDLKLVKKFGKAGEGPEEFRGYLELTPRSDRLTINSAGKLSIFRTDGSFVEELKPADGMGYSFYPLKDGYVGQKTITEGDVRYFGVFYFDTRLDEAREIYRIKDPLKRGKKIPLLTQSVFHAVQDDRIFVSGKVGLHIDVLGRDGKKLYAVGRDYPLRKFTDQDEKVFLDYFKKRLKGRFHLFKDRLAFPDYFPAIQYFLVRDNKIYVLSWKQEGDAFQFVVFDTRGKFLDQVFVPFKMREALVSPCPMDIRGGKLYQLIENEDEELELHVNRIH